MEDAFIRALSRIPVISANFVVGYKVLITVSFFYPHFDALTFLKVRVALLCLLNFLKFSF